MLPEMKLMKNHMKRFYCCSKDLCTFKNEFASNNRCFAHYAVRTSCPSLMRKDGKCWKEGSLESDEFVKQEE